MVVKTWEPKNHVKDLEEIFKVIISYIIRLNPKKCISSVESWGIKQEIITLNGSSIGIESNSDKIIALVRMKSPSNLKEE